MILKIFPFQSEIICSDSHVTTFQINNKRLFNQITNSLYALSKGQVSETQVVLLDQGKQVEFEDKVLFLSDLWQFDTNSRQINMKLIQYIEQHYKLDVELMTEIQHQVQHIQLGIREVLDELPFEGEMKEIITLVDLLKVLGVKVAKLDGMTLLDRALTIIYIVETFKLYPVIIMCNMKNYFDNNELIELYNQALHCKIQLIMIEFGEVSEPLVDEKIWYIDEDYEEFRY